MTGDPGSLYRPPRQRITHPRTEAARSSGHRQPALEIGEQTRLGEVYVSALLRSQRRLAVAVCAAVALLLGGTALCGALIPAYARVHVVGIPLPWVVLGILVYPVVIGLGWLAVRLAERTETQFMDLVRRG